MEIGLWHVDGKMPNVALMKLSTWLREKGHEPILQRTPNKRTRYASVVFSWNRPRVEMWRRAYPSIEVGGPGWSLERTLPPEIETCPADYSLYNLDYSIGFLSRGCVHNCPWCIVPEKEGKLRQVAEVDELIDPRSNHLVLLDNNLLALPNVLEILGDLAQRRLTVNFSQGLDIRLVTPEVAKVLSSVRYRNWRNTASTLHFAFDDVRYEPAVRRGIKHLLGAGIPPRHLMFYVLVGFNSSTREDLARCDVLRAYGIQPYVMRFRGRDGSRAFDPFYNALARWGNARAGLWRRPFSEYTRKTVRPTRPGRQVHGGGLPGLIAR